MLKRLMNSENTGFNLILFIRSDFGLELKKTLKSNSKPNFSSLSKILPSPLNLINSFKIYLVSHV